MPPFSEEEGANSYGMGLSFIFAIFFFFISFDAMPIRACYGYHRYQNCLRAPMLRERAARHTRHSADKRDDMLLIWRAFSLSPPLMIFSFILYAPCCRALMFSLLAAATPIFSPPHAAPLAQRHADSAMPRHYAPPSIAAMMPPAPLMLITPPLRYFHAADMLLMLMLPLMPLSRHYTRFIFADTLRRRYDDAAIFTMLSRYYYADAPLCRIAATGFCRHDAAALPPCCRYQRHVSAGFHFHDYADRCAAANSAIAPMAYVYDTLPPLFAIFFAPCYCCRC